MYLRRFINLLFFFQFKKINHANSILSDEKKRSIYDKHGSMGLYLAEQFGEDFVDTFMTMQSKWFQCCILSIFCLTGCCFCKSFAANFALLPLWSLRPNRATGSSNVNSVQEACAKCFAVHILKGLTSKPSGKYIVSPNLCFLR